MTCVLTISCMIDTMVATSSLICLRDFANNVLLKHSTWIATSGVSMFKHCQVLWGGSECV